MERELKIRTADGKWIYGLLRGAMRRPLIVFVHGLTGHMDEAIFYNAVRYFERRGFSSFRFNLYDWQKGARQLHECTLQTHADDLDRVIEYLRRRGARRVFVIGHSYGGPTILKSRARKYDTAVLWDPSFGRLPAFDGIRYVRACGAYLARWGTACLIGRAMVQEARRMSDKKSELLIESMHIPVKIIVSGKGILVRGGHRYYAAANQPKAFAVIRGADHAFSRDGNQGNLFRETLVWLRHWL